MKRFLLAGFCLIPAALVVLAQAPKDLANLIQAGNRKAALDQIRAGADVNAGAARWHPPGPLGGLPGRL